jgi:hypothetical protein
MSYKKKCLYCSYLLRDSTDLSRHIICVHNKVKDNKCPVFPFYCETLEIYQDTISTGLSRTIYTLGTFITQMSISKQ